MRRPSPPWAIVGLVCACLALAPSSAVAAACPNEQLRIESHSTSLPDCRAYELVSPPEGGLGGGDVLSYQAVHQSPEPMQAAPLLSPGEVEAGPAVLYTAEPFYKPAFGGPSEFLSRRTPAGWTTVNLTPAAVTSERIKTLAASTDLTRSLLSERGAEREASAYANLYLQEVSGPTLRPLITTPPSHRSPEEFGQAPANGERFRQEPSLLYASAAADLSRVVFEANDSLLPGAGALERELAEDVAAEVGAGEDHNYIYEWDAGGLSLVNVLPDGRVAKHADLGKFYGERVFGEEEAPNLDHAVSADGSEVFWTDEETGNLYVREHSAKTTLIAAGGEFLAATPDGSRVLYSRAGVLYEYDVQSAQTLDLSHVVGEKEGVQGLLGASENGEYVYFVATGELTGQANGRGEKAAEGADNLYVHEPDPAHPGQHTTRFITDLSPEDSLPDGQAHSQLKDWGRTVGDRTAAVSPNGLFMAFGSHGELTGVPNGGPEIYLFSVEAANHGEPAGELACASCDPSGASNSGAELPRFTDAWGTHEQRYVLDDGALLFTTTAPLVRQDTNGRSDVYEFEAGAPHLISGGTGESPAVFADATASGSDVFFTTGQQLVTQDQDGIVNIFDAKVDGGRPAVTTPVPCSTPEGCGQQAPQTPGFQAPASTTPSGQGNLAPPPPSSGAGPPKKTAAQVRAEKLTKALRACRRKRPGHKRALCEKTARKAYGARTSAHKSNRKAGR